MANYNRVILVGNLTRDPQQKNLPSGTIVSEFGMAVNHKWRSKDGQDREEVMFIDCAAFGKGAEIIQKYCEKGKQLLVEGRLKLDVWEDKQSGNKRSKHSVVVDNFQLMGGRQDDGQQQDRPAPPRQQSRGPSQKPAAQGAPFGDEQVFDDDSIPFNHTLPERWI